MSVPVHDLQNGPDLPVCAWGQASPPGGEEVPYIPGYRPLAQVQQEQVLPALLQQQHLGGGQHELVAWDALPLPGLPGTGSGRGPGTWPNALP